MIKVTKNGVPLAAIVSIEIGRPPRLFGTDSFDPASLVYARALRMRNVTEAEVRALREQFLKNWPEVAALFPKK